MRIATVLFLLLAGTSDSQAKKVKGVKSLDDKAWDEIIGGPRPVLVMFYKDNCPNCAHFNVSYRAIGRVFRDEPRVVIANVHLDHTLRLNVPIGSGCVPSCLLHSTSEHPHQSISLSQADRQTERYKRQYGPVC